MVAFGSTATVSGVGFVEITSGGEAEFFGAFNQDVTFSGVGTLALSQTPYGGTVTGFNSGGNSGDAIDLMGCPFDGRGRCMERRRGQLTFTTPRPRTALNLVSTGSTYSQGSFRADDGLRHRHGSDRESDDR